MPRATAYDPEQISWNISSTAGAQDLRKDTRWSEWTGCLDPDGGACVSWGWMPPRNSLKNGVWETGGSITSRAFSVSREGVCCDESALTRYVLRVTHASRASWPVPRAIISANTSGSSTALRIGQDSPSDHRCSRPGPRAGRHHWPRIVSDATDPGPKALRKQRLPQPPLSCI